MLTPREEQVLECVARGLQDKAIGSLLGISRKTVRTHLQSIFLKTGCRNRTAVTRWYFQRSGSMSASARLLHTFPMRNQVGNAEIPGLAGKDQFDFGGLGVDWKLDAAETGGRFSVVHHPIAPRALAAPLHRHQNEDEYSFVLKGTLGAFLGNRIGIAETGTWVAKPRGEWHTLWNASEEPCEVIEVIAPGGFEDYFREVAAAWGDVEAFAAINLKYDIEMDFDSVPALCERFGLTFPKI